MHLNALQMTALGSKELQEVFEIKQSITFVTQAQMHLIRSRVTTEIKNLSIPHSSLKITAYSNFCN